MEKQRHLGAAGRLSAFELLFTCLTEVYSNHRERGEEEEEKREIRGRERQMDLGVRKKKKKADVSSSMYYYILQLAGALVRTRVAITSRGVRAALRMICWRRLFFSSRFSSF